MGWIDYVATRASWTLKVADDGVGMPADGDKAKSGLGTSIVNALAKQLQARIVVADNYPGTIISLIHPGLALVGAEARVGAA